MGNSATRLITLIMLLQRKPNQQAADLAKTLGVSVRTLHRYITMLDEMGIPIYSERGPYGGFSLVRGYKMAPLVFTPEEAVVVSLGASLVGELWGPLYRDAVHGASAKLENILPDDQRQEVAWAQRTLVATNMHRTETPAIADTLTMLRGAIHKQQVVQLRYQGRTRDATRRYVEPYAIVHRWGWWYLVGYCQLRKAMRSFRVDRVIELATVAQHFIVPEAFDIQAYLAAEVTAMVQQRARLRFAPEAAAVAWGNRYQWEEIQGEEDGSATVTMLTPDLTWAASMVLAYNGLAVVIDPPELKQLVRAQALKIAKQYQ